MSEEEATGRGPLEEIWRLTAIALASAMLTGTASYMAVVINRPTRDEVRHMIATETHHPVTEEEHEQDRQRVRRVFDRLDGLTEDVMGIRESLARVETALAANGYNVPRPIDGD